MEQNKTEIWIRMKGDFHSFNTHCQTLKEVLEEYSWIQKRSNIAAWWRNSIGYDPLIGSSGMVD